MDEEKAVEHEMEHEDIQSIFWEEQGNDKAYCRVNWVILIKGKRQPQSRVQRVECARSPRRVDGRQPVHGKYCERR